MAKLAKYRAKRDFGRTAEPEGDESRAGGSAFVVQKHDATGLHYDFRLEHDGVLWSWAVTRGPSLDPAEKRLAVHVEDHPLDYASFEGTIPQGEYGGGAVIVWDEGGWVPEGDPAEGLKNGRLSFRLEGRKLSGGWHLVRMRARKGEKRDNWLLIKEDDAAARRDGDILLDAPESVKSGRTVEEVGGKPPLAQTPARRRKAKPVARKAAGPVTFTHPEKLLWVEAGVSKGDLLDHYERVWDRIAPFLLGRPLTLVRAPDGKKRFFQQHAWAGMPAAVATMTDPADEAELLFVRDFEGLKALVQFGIVEIHGWGAKAEDLTHPDQVTFDLDPDESVPVAALRDAALEVRARLEAAGLVAFVKTSGGKGFHITAPLRPERGWKAVEGFANGMAHAMAADAPERFTAVSGKGERAGRIYIDYLRNNPNATTVLPWSSRAKPSGTVSVPVTWTMLEAGAGPADFSLKSDALGKALRREDPWAGFRNAARVLP